MFSRTLFSRLPKPLSCRVLAPLLTQYVEAEATLTANERAVVGAHLSACPACHEETAAVRAMGALLRSRGPAALPAPVPAADLWERIEGRIVTEQRDRRRRTLSLRPVLLFAPALAALVVAAVFLMPKQSQSPIQKNAEMATAADGVGATATPKATPAASMVAMEEAETARPSLLPPPPALTGARSSAFVAAIPVPRRMASAAASDGRTRGRSPAAAPHRSAAGFAGTGGTSPTARETRAATLTARMVAPAAPAYHEITIVDVPEKPAPTVVAMARIGTAPEPRPVAPALTTGAGENRSMFADHAAKSAEITVVSSDPGSGVSAVTAYAPPPVTDTMVRQRQRRGLFGGYGAGGAVIGALPAAPAAAGAGSGPGAPW